jgi:hypothetical protein
MIAFLYESIVHSQAVQYFSIRIYMLLDDQGKTLTPHFSEVCVDTRHLPFGGEVRLRLVELQNAAGVNVVQGHTPN